MGRASETVKESETLRESEREREREICIYIYLHIQGWSGSDTQGSPRFGGQTEDSLA